LAGYFLGLVPQHMEQVVKATLQPLGIDGDDAFVQGFRDGMEAGEKYQVDRSTCSPKDADERVHASYYDGRKDGVADFVEYVAACHCGQTDCHQKTAQHPSPLVLQPCHCGTIGCLELCTIDPPFDDFQLLMHIPPESVQSERRAFWWEEDDGPFGADQES